MAKRFSHTVSREPIEFEMGGEEYTAPPILAPDTLGDLLDKQNSIAEITAKDVERETLERVNTVLADIFDLILEPESAARVRERLHSRDRPYDLQREVMPTVMSLVEEYTGRPTQPSPPSSTPSPGDGTTSTDGPPQTASTPLALPVTVS